MIENINKIIMKALNCMPEDISSVEMLSKGMTNHSYRFLSKGQWYIIRIPGEGTERLINRKQEADVYTAIKDTGLCDSPIYFDGTTGVKISRHLEGVRTCDPFCDEDVEKCVDLLRKLHDCRLKVSHRFDIFERILYYEMLAAGREASQEYEETKKHIFELRPFLDSISKEECLAHIDPVSDNFLFYRNLNGDECIQLIDWEYAGMQDPDIDIAMFAIYAFYDRARIDWLIDLYYYGKCSSRVRAKMYLYIAACGLLWSNWCEYKKLQGIDFGEYASRQYEYAVQYVEYAEDEMNSE